jgi:LPS export ABC transporter protein LptC
VSRRTRSALLFTLPSLALAAALGGCSIDYKGASLEEQTAPSGVADTVAVGLLHRVHKYGKLSFELQAAGAATWNSKNQTILTDVHFVEFDRKGGKATEGKARTVVYHTDTENAEISGGVWVHSAVEKGDLRADVLSWENKSKRLTAPADEQVTIGKDDGSTLSGTGFTGDFMKRQLFFAGPVQGTYVWQQK